MYKLLRPATVLVIVALLSTTTFLTVYAQEDPVFGLGDVDDNGTYAQNDVTLTQQHILGTSPLTCMQELRADVNASRSVSTRDLIEIQKAVNGITSDFSGLDNMLGDANVDNDVNQADLDAMQQHILGITPLSPHGAELADVNNSGSVTTLDMIKIRKCMLDNDGSYSLF